MPLLTYFYLVWLIGMALEPHTKFEVSNFTNSRDIERVPKL